MGAFDLPTKKNFPLYPMDKTPPSRAVSPLSSVDDCMTLRACEIVSNAECVRLGPQAADCSGSPSAASCEHCEPSTLFAMCA